MKGEGVRHESGRDRLEEHSQGRRQACKIRRQPHTEREDTQQQRAHRKEQRDQVQREHSFADIRKRAIANKPIRHSGLSIEVLRRREC